MADHFLCLVSLMLSVTHKPFMLSVVMLSFIVPYAWSSSILLELKRKAFLSVAALFEMADPNYL